MRPVPLANGPEDFGRPDTAQISQAVSRGEPDALSWALACLLDAVYHEARHGYPMSQRLEAAMQLGGSAIAAGALMQGAADAGRGRGIWSPRAKGRRNAGMHASSKTSDPGQRSGTTKAGSTAGASQRAH
ncbi:MAG: hypothetical protein ACLP36_00160 [Acidimicrobiales bacterium]|jgi:hypothetical protein